MSALLSFVPPQFLLSKYIRVPENPESRAAASVRSKRIAGPALRRWAPALCAALMLVSWPAYVSAQTPVASIPTRVGPGRIAVNPVTNKAYVLNLHVDTVTEIDGITNEATNIRPGFSYPIAVAVNPQTNKIYVANLQIRDLSVIDGATNQVTLIPLPDLAYDMALNPVTNKIYVSLSQGVEVVDGATSAVTNVPANFPRLPAVNPVTNKIYVGVTVSGGYSVAAIDGDTNSTTLIPLGTDSADEIEVNSVTNKIYVSVNSGKGLIVIDGATNTAEKIDLVFNSFVVDSVTNHIFLSASDGSLLSMDGATNAVSTLATGLHPAYAMVLNPMTHQIYVDSNIDNTMTSIDELNGAITTVQVGINPGFLAVNPVTDRIYVPTAGNEFLPPNTIDGGNASVTVVDGATNKTTTIETGASPHAVAVNAVTSRAYIANRGGNNVAVIDAAGNMETVPTGKQPSALAVNPITDQTYVANNGSNDVTIIHGTHHETSTVKAGKKPIAVAVNPATGRVYIANSASNDVTVLHANRDSASTIPVGISPAAIAVNPVTDLIYVADSGSNEVSVIDGATHVTTTVPVGSSPVAIAVDSLTNKIYVADSGASSVTVIDGVTNATTSVPVGLDPVAVAVNPLTNKIYAADSGSNDVTVIDGATNNTTKLPAGTKPVAIAVDLTSNKIYVANSGSNQTTVIDGETNTIISAPGGLQAVAVDVNPVTNQIFLANATSNDVTILTEQQIHQIPLTTSISPLPKNETTNPSPAFTFSAASSFAPTAPPVYGLYFQVDTWQGTWTPAIANADGTYSGAAPVLPLGTHILYAFATDEQSSAVNWFNSVVGNGNLAAYLFVVKAKEPERTKTLLLSSADPAEVGTSVTFEATILTSDGTPSGKVAFYDGEKEIGSMLLAADGTASFSTSSLQPGDHQITAKYFGDDNYRSSSDTLSQVMQERHSDKDHDNDGDHGHDNDHDKGNSGGSAQHH